MNLQIFTFYYRNYFLLNKQFSIVSTDEKTAKVTLLKVQKIADYILDVDSELIEIKVKKIKEGVII